MNIRPNSIKVWPHLALVFAVFAALGAGAAALWMRNEPKVEAMALPHAARVERVDGEVGLSRDLGANVEGEADWVELTPNTPLTTGDRLYARDDSHASLAFTGRNFATVYPDSALDVVTLSDRRTQLALRQGSALFDVGALGPGEMFEVATPYGAVDFREPGLYHMGYNDDGSAFVSVLSGLAEVAGLAGTGQISKGEMLTLLGQTAAQVALSRLNPDYAGGLLDDYYGYRYPDNYDGRYSDYNAYLNDPDYYDPYNSYQSYRYVPASVPGAYDLDRYGDWQNLNGYGHAWSPRVEQGWAPYRDGHWMMDDPYGLTWVSDEPWGYAPYHYGRWVSVDDRWFWVPDAADTQPAYAPALVAFLPGAGANQVGWVPLAPGEQYAPAYYDENWQPHYYGDHYDAPERVANMGAPNGLTVVSFDDFGRPVEHDRLARFDPRSFEGVRPLSDPLSHAVLRQMSLERAVERRGFVLPPGLAKKLEERQVYASAPPPRFRDGDSARRFRVEAVPENNKREKLKFKDERQQPLQVAAPPRGFEERRRPREERREERREEKAERRAERGRDSQTGPVSPEAERVSARREEFARGERDAQARQAQAAHERQTRASERQQRFEARRQAEAHAQAQRHAERQRAQQAGAERAMRQQEMTRARQAQQQHQRAERQQHQQQRQAVQGPPRQERKQQQSRAGGPPSDGGGGKSNGQGRGGGGGKGKGKP